jgi:peptide/nickel transport system permease protein
MTGLRRFGQYALVLWVAATLNFALPHLAPGDPVLMEHLPWTVALVGTATILSAVIGTLLGAWAAWRRGTRRGTTTVAGVLLLDAMPGFWIGMILIATFAVQLGWFPSYGAATITAEGLPWVGEVLDRMVLPVATLVLAGVGGYFLLARAAMVGLLDEPFLRLARAKGLSERRVALRHGLRNALLPVYTNLTLGVGALLSGAVVVETVFAYPGLGRLIFDAVTVRDYPLLQGGFLLVMLGTVAANLFADPHLPVARPSGPPRGGGAGGVKRLARRFTSVGTVILATLVTVAVAAPLLAPYDPTERSGMPFARPSGAHLLGTNDAGQDLLSELIYGSRISLLVGVVAALAATMIGTSVGIVAGYSRGWLDNVLMRLVDVVLTLPVLPLTIVIGVFAGPGLSTQIVVIAAVIWAGMAR